MRRPQRLLLLSLIVLVTLPGIIEGRALTINFDTDPQGDPIVNGSVINGVFQVEGVQLETIDRRGACGDDDRVYANGDQGPGGTFATAPNTVSICRDGDFSDWSQGGGIVRATLERPAVEACVVVRPSSDDDLGVLRAVDVSGELVEELAVALSDPGRTERICVRWPGFRAVEFAGANNRFARFDDLRITFAASLVDFDVTPEGDPVDDGTAVNDLYASQGVRFEHVGKQANCGDGDVYANDDQGVRPEPVGSPPNVVSVCNGRFSDFTEGSSGGVRAEFDRPVSQVCIEAFADDGVAVMRGFDVFGEEIDEAFTEGSNQILCVSDPAIAAVEFAGFEDGFARFDNLSFTLARAALDFDSEADGSPIVGGSVVNTTYASSGVLLERDGLREPICGEGKEVYANGDVRFASLPNNVSVCNSQFSDFNEGREGMVHALFETDAYEVCVSVRPTQSADFAVLRAYDHNDVLLDETSSEAGESEVLCITGEGIRGVRFAGGEKRYARFDDLEVQFVPEPAQGWLAAAALLALAGLARLSGVFS